MYGYSRALKKNWQKYSSHYYYYKYLILIKKAIFRNTYMEKVLIKYLKYAICNSKSSKHLYTMYTSSSSSRFCIECSEFDAAALPFQNAYNKRILCALIWGSLLAVKGTFTFRRWASRRLICQFCYKHTIFILLSESLIFFSCNVFSIFTSWRVYIKTPELFYF